MQTRRVGLERKATEELHALRVANGGIFLNEDEKKLIREILVERGVTF